MHQKKRNPSKNMNERNQLGGLGVNGKIILKWILKSGRLWTRFM